MITVEDVRLAAANIRGAVYRSPCPYSLSLSRFCGCDIYCKLDHLQMTGSFKERGARNKLLSLTDEQRKVGVIACSAGNHALGLAYHGQSLGIPVTVVMPRFAPLVKVTNCRTFGANIILHGDTFEDARRHALELSTQRNLLFVSGFDDEYIMAGAGTVGLEILEDVPDVDVIIVPVGGGGLLAGIGTVIKALRPQTRIIAVEPINAPTLDASLKAGRVVPIQVKPTLADGLAVGELGARCFPILQKVVDELVLVDEAQIASAVLRLLELEKTVCEGAGATPLAAAVLPSLGLAGKKVVLTLCGGNIDVTILSRIIERGLAADGRLCRINVGISDRPGGLAQLAKAIASAGASVKEVHHDRSFGPADVSRVYVTCVLETRNFDHIREVLTALRAADIEVLSTPSVVDPA